MTLVTLAVVRELRQLAGTLETNPIQLLDFDSPLLGPLLRRIDQYVDLERFQSPEFLSKHLEAWTTALAASTLGVVGGAVGAIVQMFLVVFTMFYLFRDGEAHPAAPPTTWCRSSATRRTTSSRGRRR